VPSATKENEQERPTLLSGVGVNIPPWMTMDFLSLQPEIQQTRPGSKTKPWRLMSIEPKYDVVILGAGHNGLVAAGYLARAGLSVLLLEKNDYIGGATTSQKLFPDYDAQLSRYSYLVSLLPDKIIRDLGLNIELRSRTIASFTPYERDGAPRGLLLSNVSETASRASLRELTGRDTEFEQLQKFYSLAHLFADQVWDSMLSPLRAKKEVARQFEKDAPAREAWRSLVEEPLGLAIERYLQDDLLRGVVFTDGKIGVVTHAHDPTLLQNRCFLYHLIGNRTGEWKVPVGGMGSVVDELTRVAASHGAVMHTNVRLKTLDFSAQTRTVHFELGDHSHTVEARFVLVNFGANVLAQLLQKPYQPDSTHEGSVVKINMLLHRLPCLRASGISAPDAFSGTFHIDEGYEQMKRSYDQSAHGQLPEKIPCEIYCHTLTDDSILSSQLRTRGFHTLTLFALDTPWRLFRENNREMRLRAMRQCLTGLNAHLAEPIEECLAVGKDGELCVETKTPVDLEEELGLYHGNIFHAALTFPFAENSDTIGSWGVETEFSNVFICGSSARRGGAVSGIPGHNAAMKILEMLKLI
jgi:phytoene dehydrogenase-like protein